MQAQTSSLRLPSTSGMCGISRRISRLWLLYSLSSSSISPTASGASGARVGGGAGHVRPRRFLRYNPEPFTRVRGSHPPGKASRYRKPSSLAFSAACVRSRTPSLPMMLLRWFLTVPLAMKRDWLISRLEAPRASRDRISRSRSVNGANTPVLTVVEEEGVVAASTPGADEADAEDESEASTALATS